MAFHSVRHHHSYKSNDCTSKSFSNPFLGSSISKNNACARIKKRSYLTIVTAPYSIDSILEDIKDDGIMYLGVDTDGTNHKSTNIFLFVI